MELWTIYILRCNDGSLYTGITRGLSSRIEQHQTGKASKYTRGRLPVELVYSERRRSRSRALKREAEIKGWSREQKLKLIARGSASR